MNFFKARAAAGHRCYYNNINWQLIYFENK